VKIFLVVLGAGERLFGETSGLAVLTHDAVERR
jgi:hypothetical protein